MAPHFSRKLLGVVKRIERNMGPHDGDASHQFPRLAGSFLSEVRPLTFKLPPISTLIDMLQKPALTETVALAWPASHSTPSVWREGIGASDQRACSRGTNAACVLMRPTHSLEGKTRCRNILGQHHREPLATPLVQGNGCEQGVLTAIGRTGGAGHAGASVCARGVRRAAAGRLRRGGGPGAAPQPAAAHAHARVRARRPVPGSYPPSGAHLSHTQRLFSFFH